MESDTWNKMKVFCLNKTGFKVEKKMIMIKAQMKMKMTAKLKTVVKL